jgi:hypothetical protein
MPEILAIGIDGTGGAAATRAAPAVAAVAVANPNAGPRRFHWASHRQDAMYILSTRTRIGDHA